MCKYEEIQRDRNMCINTGYVRTPDEIVYIDYVDYIEEDNEKCECSKGE